MVAIALIGAGGVIGTERGARAPADGYTLVQTGVGQSAVAHGLDPNLKYDSNTDFIHVSQIHSGPNLLVVNPTLPVSNVKDLVALAKAKPNTLNYASGGTGSTSHFAIALFVSAAGIANATVHVPYKGGAPSVAATVSNETQFYFGPMAGSIPQVKAGRLRAVAVGGAARSALLPDVPTVRESGVNYAAAGWFGLLGPAGLPKPVVQRLNKAVHDTVGMADVQRQLLEVGAEGVANTPEAFAKFIAEQLASTRRVVKELGLRFD
jgi:tripartite-type tricarboxylate transporter receptor subunit TctC